MIVRKPSGGELWMIGQTDHSRLVGQFAAHWGNEHFAKPTPYISMARAAAFHDYGWLRYETAPAFDAATHETPNFRDISADDRRLEEYQWCLDWLLGSDRYASLIVNMHRTGLWRGRYGAMRHPELFINRQSQGIEAFINVNEARQEHEKAGLDEQILWTNYRLLQVWDYLGLYFACAEACDEYLEPVPTSYDGEKDGGVRMTLTPKTSEQIVFDPYPFDVRPLTVGLAFKRMPKVTYTDKGAFEEAYFKSPTELMTFELV